MALPKQVKKAPAAGKTSAGGAEAKSLTKRQQKAVADKENVEPVQVAKVPSKRGKQSEASAEEVEVVPEEPSPKCQAPAKRGRPKTAEAPAESPVKRQGKKGKRGQDLSGALSPMVKNLSRKLKQAAAAEAPEEPLRPAKKESKAQELLGAIRRTIASVPFKAPFIAGVRLHPGVLTSYDEDGFPSMRTVIPHEMAEDLSEVCIRTNMATRKVQEIQRNKKVSLHFQDQRGRGGWVTLKGDAKVDFVGASDDVVELRLRPDCCECVSYVEGPTSADAGAGWKPAVLQRQADGWRRSQ